MAVTVHDLSKNFGIQKAVDNVSFSVETGEVVGFLGPNGAGKSTTMKIITGFIPPSSGSAVVNGLNVAAEPLAVKRMIGYLPEHNPLYADMYVKEYLLFTAGLYGIRGKQAITRVRQMIELCGLTVEQNKKIDSLSKGYRQRVGLAAALIHDPKVLILDEPTSGLDPNQLIEIRKVIKDVSRDKTVIFSTHIMQEVEALCDRVLLINQGVLIADESLASLKTRKTSQAVVVEFQTPVQAELLAAIAGVTKVTMMSTHVFKLQADGNTDIRPAIFRFAADHQLSLVGLKQEASSLESIFQELTQATA